MPTYAYACSSCGTFDLVRAIVHREEPARCPECCLLGTRVFAAPHLRRLDQSLDRAAMSAGLSAESPQVTRRIPPTAPRTRVAARRPGSPPLPKP